METAQTQVRTFPAGHLAEAVGEDCQSWEVPRDRQWARRSPTRVFLETPADGGGLAFIRKVLLPFAAQRGRRVLLLTRRRELLEEGTPGELVLRPPNDSAPPLSIPARTVEEAGRLTVISHDAVLEFLQENGEFSLYTLREPCYYVVLDGAHFFLEDALRCPWTEQVFQFVTDFFSGSVQVYLSPAMEDSRPALLEGICRADTSQRPGHMVDSALYREDVRCWQAEPVQGRYVPGFYSGLEELAREIAGDSGENKWLVFVSAREAGRELLRQVNERRRGAALLLTPERRRSAAWRRLETEGTCQESVLIVLRGMEDELRLRDPRFRRAALPTGRRGELLRMLDCLPPETPAEVWVQIPDLQQINQQLLRLEGQLAVVEQVRSASREANRRLLRQFWLQSSPNVNRLFQIDREGRLVPNRLAECRLLLAGDFYRGLREHWGDPDAYPRLVQAWLGSPGGAVRRLGRENSFADMDAFVRSYLGRPVAEGEQERFYREFLLCYQRTSGPLLRKARGRRKATINQGLAALGYSCQVYKRAGEWILSESRKKPID